MNEDMPDSSFAIARPKPWPLIGLATLLVLSLIGNLWLATKSAPTPSPQGARPPVCPPAPTPECPACPTCAVCEVCPTIPDAGTATAAPSPESHAPRVDEAAAAEGEAHVARAEEAAERDPVQVAAQRRLADGIDRIVDSRSPRAASRFIKRNLPSFASMECAFRDPAAAEHVRMQLRALNAVLPENERLTEDELRRYERDLRCPRD